MGNPSKKTGKARLDKYYKLAKEQGYRARSAFKLIQLNKKFAFLESSRCCIDLCAAPGGWLQVASKYMPVNSLILGVDLVAIKPIPRVITFASDITTPHCRNLIRNELKNWKADVILHDGAPNVGTAWIQDAFCQSELVLMSLRLAVEFLTKGGTFVTKVFRSVDYNNLIWVFNQLFGKVDATKPPSSRNVSAEIFVVCRDFLSPEFIDPKLLDSKHVFKDLTASRTETNVFQPSKHRRKRDGYDAGDYTLFKTVSAATFVKGTDPVSVLGSANKINFETEEEKGWQALDITTQDIQINCNDLKVLGKGDFKALMKWRIALLKEITVDVVKEPVQEVTNVTDDVDNEQQLSEELDHLLAEAAARRKRARRHANEVKARAIQRMQLKMTAPLDIGLQQHDQSLDIGQDDMFDSDIKNTLLQRHDLSTSMEDCMLACDESDEGDVTATDSHEGYATNLERLETELDDLYETYQERALAKDMKYRARAARQDKSDQEWCDRPEKRKFDESGDEVSLEKDGKGQRQMSESLSAGSCEEEVDERSLSLQTHKRTTSHKTPKRLRLTSDSGNSRASTTGLMWFDHALFSGVTDHDNQSAECVDVDVDDGEIQEPSSNSSGNDYAESPDKDIEEQNTNDIEQARVEVTLEGVTLAQELTNRKKTKTQLINDGFNRYSLNSKEGLPSWFLDDESKHHKPILPITKEAVATLRAKQRTIDARPIKKIAEAKARKKLRAYQRLEKATKTAEGMNANSELSEREKAQRIEKLMRKSMASGRKDKQVKVVVAKGSHKGLKGRPKGVKGRYVMVDSRMKKEVRAKKRKAKANKGKPVHSH